MGRQIQVCTTDSDNHLFENYLRSTFDCDFYQSSAPTSEEIRIKDFTKTSFPFSSQIFIHNKQFFWKPKYKQDKTEAKNFCLSNNDSAPLIEFSKTLWSTKNSHGRIYWKNNFLSNTLEYDIDEFAKFYEAIIKWFKKNSKEKIKYGGTNVYYFNGAWEKYNKFQEKGV